MKFLILAVLLFSLDKGDVKVSIEAKDTKIDLSRSTYLTVKVEGTDTPDLRERFVGFSLAEDYEVSPGVTSWRLVPRPGEKAYKLLPFAVGNHLTKAVYFEMPDALPLVSGEMEVVVKKDFPPLSWKLVGQISLALLGIFLCIYLLFLLIRLVTRRVKEHFMSPIERAYVELERLLKRDFVKKGLFKDFYVELTLVVRRYIQRKYGIKAPHMTTEEFLAHVSNVSNLSNVSNVSNLSTLSSFLSSADLIKFAGVMASEETAAEATEKARAYLKKSEEGTK